MLYIKKAIPTEVRIAQLIFNVSTTFQSNSNTNQPLQAAFRLSIVKHYLFSMLADSVITTLASSETLLLLKNKGACYDNYQC